MDFRSIYRHGLARVAAATFPVSLAHPERNQSSVLALASECAQRGAVLVVFPELCLSGYALDDLHRQDTLLDAVEAAILQLADASRDLLPLIIVGAALRFGDGLYNCAVLLHRGRVVGVVPKSYLPNYGEFYERRQFRAGVDITGCHIRLGTAEVPFGVDLLFCAKDIPDFILAVELCEDIWVPSPPSTRASIAGATVIANLSASNITIGKSELRHLLCRAQSLRCASAYIYAAAGAGESTNDMAWDGQVSIFENGNLLAETERFPTQPRYGLADIDLELLRNERARNGSFGGRPGHLSSPPYRRVEFCLNPPRGDIGLCRSVERFPFVPAVAERLDQDCYEAYEIQVSALKQRLQAAGARAMVIGVSGGLDSTQALLVSVKAADDLGWPRSNIHAYTMPGFGTGSNTRNNALALMRELGVRGQELDIKPSAALMLEQLGHPYSQGEDVFDTTFENVQAGLRTDYLFRLANQSSGLVIGTGDMSELALGWCTYGVGDQMAHYNVNAGLPKTLIQYLIRWIVQRDYFSTTVNDLLSDILETEISPELIPAAAGGCAPQSTEAVIGPYELQDFNLYYTLKYGFRPSKIAFLAEAAWGDARKGSWPAGFPAEDRHAYNLDQIRRWLEVFVRRFFGFSQFKRSAMPNGPKVSAGGALSPRGDWRAPSDGSTHIWLEEIKRNIPTSP